jgi:hypothetical protein
MKVTAATFLAIVTTCGVNAFAPLTALSTKVVGTTLNSVFDDYVGGVDFRGQKFEFDPVS